MRATIRGKEIVFAKSGDKEYPVALFIDDLFIDKFSSFFDAEKVAKEICEKYPAADKSDITPEQPA